MMLRNISLQFPQISVSGLSEKKTITIDIFYALPNLKIIFSLQYMMFLFCYSIRLLPYVFRLAKFNGDLLSVVVESVAPPTLSVLACLLPLPP
jgi:hypothetical protein